MARGTGSLQRYHSVEEATEIEKELIRSSLTQLCMRLKSVSRENSIAPASRGSVPSLMTTGLMTTQPVKPESCPPDNNKDQPVGQDETEKAKKALRASCERVTEMQNLIKGSTPEGC